MRSVEATTQPLTVHRYGSPDAGAPRAAQGERMLTQTSWSRAEVEAWAACKPLVDRRYIRRGLSLGGPEREGLFNRLTVPTLLLISPDAVMAPRPEAVHNELVWTVAIPGSGHCVRRDQPARYHQEVDTFLAEVR